MQVLCIGVALLEREVVLMAAGLPLERIDEIRQLRAAKLVRTDDSRSNKSLDVYHQRIREIVCSQLSAEQARELHGPIAEGLERVGDDRVGLQDDHVAAVHAALFEQAPSGGACGHRRDHFQERVVQSVTDGRFCARMERIHEATSSLLVDQTCSSQDAPASRM